MKTSNYKINQFSLVKKLKHNIEYSIRFPISDFTFYINGCNYYITYDLDQQYYFEGNFKTDFLHCQGNVSIIHQSDVYDQFFTTIMESDPVYITCCVCLFLIVLLLCVLVFGFGFCLLKV